MRKFTCIIVGLFCSLSCLAADIVIKSPDYFKKPANSYQPVYPDSLSFPEDAESIHIKDVGMIGRLGDYGFTNLKKVTIDDIDYVSGALFMYHPTIEEIEFNGLIGHFDCALVLHCPNLRIITFNGPVSSTGGPGFMFDCPQLESVVFNGPVVNFGLSKFPDEEMCPKFTNYEINGGILSAYNENLTPVWTIDQIRQNPESIEGLERIADWQIKLLNQEAYNFLSIVAYEDAKVLLPILEQLNSEKATRLKESMNYAYNLGDYVKTKLEILKNSPSYAEDSIIKPKFQYASPSDSLLTLSRERFNLDSVAGAGDDISRIKNLMYWVHDNIAHNGGNGLAPGGRNLRNTYDSALRDSCGYNCRALAICLTEALLAEGIPARFVTCESKAWDTDGDCHVICVAWSESLNKWVWVDPTFAAFITDENGVMLHPGEVRYRLQNDLPLHLNEDANWNHRSQQTKKHYLDEYMAKNLYIMSVNTINQAEPEGETNHPKGQYVALVPKDSNYTNANVITTDDEWFWQAPNQ